MYHVPQAMAQGSELLSEVAVLGAVVAILVTEYSKGRQEGLEVEEEEVRGRQEVRERLYRLEVGVERSAGHIHTVARTAVKHMGQLGGSREVSEELEVLLAAKPKCLSDIKPIEILGDDEAERPNKVEKDPNVVKTMSDELMELWEEIVEEFLDTVNPDDD